MAKNLNIKKGDVVRVIAGKDKGAEGKVISVNAESERVIVEGVNRIKRHTKWSTRAAVTAAPAGSSPRRRRSTCPT
jgi:large subunit ribosomal protein L24